MHRDSPPAEACSSDPGTGACALGPAAEAPRPAAGGRAVWLRANGRPGGIVFGLAVAVSLAVLLLARPWSRPVSGGAWLVVAGVLATGAGAAVLSSRPRLVLDRDTLRVHLAPGRVDLVPLDVVECFFLGSRLEPPAAGDESSGGERVRTLVMRIAERARDHAARPTLPLWGAWSEGSVTIDGRWCAPLSVDLVRRLNRDLTAAKRAARAPRGPAGEGA